ncbi:MAG: hypothetical protein ACRC5T_06435 [Cetobacterium sp.]
MVDRMFSDDFINEFNSSDFYAKPKMTELTISFGGKSVTIGNAVTLNVEHSNEKIPVYSYNSDTFAKYLNGKDVITGALALRKTTVDSFISLIVEKENENIMEVEGAKIETKVETVNGLINSTEDPGEINFLLNKIKALRFDTSKTYAREIAKDKGLLYYSDISTKNNARITITYKDNMLEEQDSIYDILFTKKNSDISVNNNDIIEVYQFIGNPKGSMGHIY